MVVDAKTQVALFSGHDCSHTLIRFRVPNLPKVLLLAFLPACASVVPNYEEIAQPAAPPEVGKVILFTGFNWSGESHHATGTAALAQDIRRAGVPAIIYRPDDWARAVEDVMALQPRPVAISVYGYSAGGRAAARFAKRVGEAGIHIETMVLLETWGAVEVACTVKLALQLRLEAGDVLAAARPQCTETRDVLIETDLVPHIDTLGHLSVAVDPDVMQLLMKQLVGDGQVRRRDIRS